MGLKLRALFVVPCLILTLCSLFGLAGYFLGRICGIPDSFHFPWIVHVLGAIVLAAGFAMIAWIWRYRKPVDILVSTYVTIYKNVRRTPPENPSARTEPLVLEGPQRYVRNPMYFAVVLLWLGWWLVADCTFLLLMAFFFFLWFNLVVIRVEERELRALYGEEYEKYARAVPRFFPSWKSRWP
jgi:protein-S-isoprenylcysteine O-methyltransferase Ste14